MFKEYYAKYNGKLSDLNLYSPADNRDVWDNLDSDSINFIVAEADKYINFDYPYIKATDFLEFTRTGNRTNYEDKLFAKRRALSSLVLGECVLNNGKYMDDIINGIYAICDETCWQLPAHNTYIRDTPNLNLPDTTRPIIELFSCEVAAILSTVYYLLPNKLDEVSPFIRKRIFDEINRRVIIPYLNEHFWWMGKDDEEMCNWTIWCTQNILITAFSLPFDEKVRHNILKKACDSVDYFLKDYGEDGCCEEGAQYYRHAGLCLFQTLYILCNITHNSFSELFRIEKIKNIGSYILNVHINDQYYINFADCSPIAGRAGVREFLYGKMTDNKSLCEFAAKDYLARNAVYDINENNLFYRLQEVMTRKDILDTPIPKVIEHPNIYYSSVGLFIAHNETYDIGVKAGDNADSHNHNDTGSVTLYKNGLVLLADIGVESYTQKTFSKDRYEIWTMQSDYHNLPTINGLMQKDGKDYCANVHNYSFANSNNDSSYITLDISKAYPARACVKSYIRKVTTNPKGVTITDTYDVTATGNTINPVILNFITYEKPEILENHIVIGDLATMRIDSENEKDVVIEELPITDKRLMICWKHSMYRIRIKLCKPKDCVNIVIV